MSVLIKGMKMPTGCATCKMFGEYGCPFIGAVGYALTRGKRNEDCPLIELPPHGRLIDADALIKRFVTDPLYHLVEPYGVVGVIDFAPVIIEAEVEE